MSTLLENISTPHSRRLASDIVRNSVHFQKGGPFIFEYLCGFLLQLEFNYEDVTVTQKTNDKGIDLIFTGKKLGQGVGYAQCKRHKTAKVDEHEIRKFWGSSQMFPHDRKIAALFFFSYTDFTDPAKQKAKEWGIQLCGGEYLSSLIELHVDKLLRQFIIHNIPLLTPSGQYELVCVNEYMAPLPKFAGKQNIHNNVQTSGQSIALPNSVLISNEENTFSKKHAIETDCLLIEEKTQLNLSDLQMTNDLSQLDSTQISEKNTSVVDSDEISCNKYLFKKRKFDNDASQMLHRTFLSGNKHWRKEEDDLILKWNHLWKTDVNNVEILNWKAKQSNSNPMVVNFLHDVLFLNKRSLDAVKGRYYKLMHATATVFVSKADQKIQNMGQMINNGN